MGSCVSSPEISSVDPLSRTHRKIRSVEDYGSSSTVTTNLSNTSSEIDCLNAKYRVEKLIQRHLERDWKNHHLLPE